MFDVCHTIYLVPAGPTHARHNARCLREISCRATKYRIDRHGDPGAIGLNVRPTARHRAWAALDFPEKSKNASHTARLRVSTLVNGGGAALHLGNSDAKPPINAACMH